MKSKLFVTLLVTTTAFALVCQAQTNSTVVSTMSITPVQTPDGAIPLPANAAWLAPLIVLLGRWLQLEMPQIAKVYPWLVANRGVLVVVGRAIYQREAKHCLTAKSSAATVPESVNIPTSTAP